MSNRRTDPQPGLSGECPGCSKPVVAKCGERKIWHWAHRREAICDKWWETETAWHRSWKTRFPDEWQEVIRRDDSGEKHIADVLTNHDLTIEFQYSPIDSQERLTRERFYKEMLWVVNGSRRKNDFKKFFKWQRSFVNPSEECFRIEGFAHKFFCVPSPERFFPEAWIQSSVPVLFDFSEVVAIDEQIEKHKLLWCLLPDRLDGHAIIASISCEVFVSAASSGRPLLPPREDTFNASAKFLKEREAKNVERWRKYLDQKYRFRTGRGT